VRLEPDEGKLSRPVLRGLGRSNPARLPDRPYHSNVGRIARFFVQIGEFITRLTEEMPGHHRTFSPLSNAELEEWRAKWPGHSPPEDLLELLCHSNGIQFWVHEGSPEGYFRLLPLREIDSARRIMWLAYGDSLGADEVPYPHWLAISEHQDGGSYIILDTDKQNTI
jgi:hypothetical protein